MLLRRMDFVLNFNAETEISGSQLEIQIWSSEERPDLKIAIHVLAGIDTDDK